MKRNTLALAAGVALALGSSVVITAEASFVKTSATLMMQGQSASRWQPDRFGPIVSSDTLWSIAMYYGDKSDLSVYEMMDLFIELNPEAFINGRADRMMDGFYLKVPQRAQQANAQRQAEATSTDSPSASVTETPASSPATSAEPATSESDGLTFSVEELTRLRDQLAESTALIENLNSENARLQERLVSVTAELDELQKKVNAEQVAEANLQQQIAAEIAASNAATETSEIAQTSETSEASEAAPVVTSEPERSQSDQTAETSTETTTEQAAARIVSETEEVAKQAQAAEAKPEPVAKPVSKRQKQSDFDAFLSWLMQPFQLTLAILIPLLIAAIIWYVLYVRRLNREHLGPYNGALQAAEKDKNEEANQEPQALSAYEEAEQAAAAEEAADMPEFERIDDDVDIDAQADEQVAQNEAEQLDDELEQLGQDEDATADKPEDDHDDQDLDTLLSGNFDEPELEVSTEDANELEPEPEFEASELAESDDETVTVSQDNDDMSLDFVVDAPKASATGDTDDTDSTEIELDQFDNINLDDIDLEGLTTEADSDNSDADKQDADDEGYLDIDDLLAEADNDATDFDSPRFEREAGQLDDEETPSGMLDLARAYIELDEYELARTELNKVAESDDDDAKREAAMLLQKLDEQGH